MRQKLAILVVCLLAWPLLAHAGDLIDRIVATVNGHIILQTDWEDAIYWEAFSTGRPAGQFSLADRKAVLDRLIDQELLREQMSSSDTSHASADQVAKRTAEIRRQYSEASTDDGWRNVLAQYHLDPDQVTKRVMLELDLLRLVDARFRPTIQVDAKSIESYYSEELLPHLRQAGADAVPLDEATPKIKELLTQQKMNQLLTAWLQNLRADSKIDTAVVPIGGQAR